MTRFVEAKLRLRAEDKTAAGLNSATTRLKAFEQRSAAGDRAAAGLARRRQIEEKARMISAKYHQARVMGALTAGARVVGSHVGAAALTKSFTDFAKFDRQPTNIGITADTTKEEMEDAAIAVRRIASEAATPIDDVIGGLDTLVAAGRKRPEAMAFRPTVTRTALATTSAVDDIAKSADAMGQSFKIAASDMERAFDIVSHRGKEWRFETKDQRRSLPSIAPLAATRGHIGLEGLTHVGAVLRVIQKNAGTAEEAAASMTDVLGKIVSDETINRMSKEFGADLPKTFTKSRTEGENTFDAFLDPIAPVAFLFTDGDMGEVARRVAEMVGVDPHADPFVPLAGEAATLPKRDIAEEERRRVALPRADAGRRSAAAGGAPEPSASRRRDGSTPPQKAAPGARRSLRLARRIEAIPPAHLVGAGARPPP